MTKNEIRESSPELVMHVLGLNEAEMESRKGDQLMLVKAWHVRIRPITWQSLLGSSWSACEFVSGGIMKLVKHVSYG
ncbi:hypothetical protein K2173_005647 [Erythroxylum novogranatense]|uniref:Uncharacterized protein n=1 Tax=Erythroxylum novogranatense TaxID=1862640 RepID=A0AAV8SR36_9ROSI|nr:hypothetical protein K2173_005647 [Erythroxylum novogranatense]